MNYAFWAVVSGNLGQDLLNDTRRAQTTFRDAMDYQWHQYIGTGSHPVWLVMNWLGGLIAAGALFFLAVDIFKKLEKNDFQRIDLQDFILPMVITVLLVNNAFGAGQLALGMRAIGQSVNFQIADSFGVYNQTSTDFAKANQALGNEEVRAEVNKAQKACASLFDDRAVYNQCVTDALEKATEEIRQSNANGGLIQSMQNLLQAGRNNVVDFTTYATSSVLLADDRIRLYASAVAFTIAADMALFFVGLGAPLALSLAIIPSTTNGLFAWLSAFYFIQITLVAYTIMVSLMADISTNGRGLESFVFALLLGKVIPTLAVLFGAGGGMTMFSSLSGMGLSGISQFSSMKLLSKLKPRRKR